MTKEQKVKLAAKAAIVAGPALIAISVLALTGIYPLEPDALKAAPMGVLMGCTTLLLGISALRA